MHLRFQDRVSGQSGQVTNQIHESVAGASQEPQQPEDSGGEPRAGVDRWKTEQARRHRAACVPHLLQDSKGIPGPLLKIAGKLPTPETGAIGRSFSAVTNYLTNFELTFLIEEI